MVKLILKKIHELYLINKSYAIFTDLNLGGKAYTIPIRVEMKIKENIDRKPLDYTRSGMDAKIRKIKTTK